MTDALAILRKPFEARHISKLPKPTKAQTEAVRNDYREGQRCGLCGSWHHPDVVHLDYVGHAALTDRLLDADPMWSWEPVAFNDVGLPAFDPSGGLWIRLTVGGVSRLGYGHAAGKPNADPGAREKEVIGDALRNAAMRFGAALDLWHKGDLHGPEAEGDQESEAEPDPAPPQRPRAVKPTLAERAEKLITAINAAPDDKALAKVMANGSGLCAELDDKDPDLLATVELAHKARQAVLDENPFAAEAA